LKSTGQLDRTVIVFMGDNGLLEGEHGMVDKRTMHEPSIRIPIIARGPGLPAGKVVPQQVLTLDIAPSAVGICAPRPRSKTFRVAPGANSVNEGDPEWRTAWFYEYNYEKQFPYTPNVRGIRTDAWKFVRYPHGDGSPDRHIPELYDLAKDPGELDNLANNRWFAEQRSTLEKQLATMLAAEGLTPEKDKMPLDEGIKTALPDQKIR
jgi:N-acetylglucosamine-6-sulfatase